MTKRSELSQQAKDAVERIRKEMRLFLFGSEEIAQQFEALTESERIELVSMLREMKRAKLAEQQNNCCGTGPHTLGECRMLPYGGDGNLILCHACFNREIDYRVGCNETGRVAMPWSLPQWESLKVYEPE